MIAINDLLAPPASIEISCFGPQYSPVPERLRIGLLVGIINSEHQ